MNIRLREGCAADLAWFLLLHANDVFNRWIGENSRGKQSVVEAFFFKIAAQRDRRGVFLVAEINGIPRGYGALLCSVGGESAHIELGVEPGFQGIGVGGVLLDEALHLVNSVGTELNVVKAVCHRENESCIRLLTSRHFRLSEFQTAVPAPYLLWQLIV